MDFMHNPTGFDLGALPKEAHDYLEKSGALCGTPIERLLAMNTRAYDLYLSHKIDLKTDYLRVAVCAQHQNGGIRVNRNYQTTVEGLYAVGEAAGVFGVYRPGGSALNSTQVSSLRAAEHISVGERRIAPDIQEEARRFINSFHIGPLKDAAFPGIQKHLQSKMSDYAAFLRDAGEIRVLKTEVERYLEESVQLHVAKEQLAAYLKYRDFLITAREVLTAMELWCNKIGARGSALTVGGNRTENIGMMVCTGGGRAWLEQPEPIPQSEVWFEKVYNCR